MISHLDMTAAEISSYIPKQKKLVDQQALEAQLNLITKKAQNYCYYCQKIISRIKQRMKNMSSLNIPGKVMLSFQTGFD